METNFFYKNTIYNFKANLLTINGPNSINGEVDDRIENQVS